MIPFHTKIGDLNRLKKNYLIAYSDLSELEAAWTRLRTIYPCLTVFPKSIEDIMKADYKELIDYYRKYQCISQDERDKMKSDLVALFAYDDKYRETIKEFIMDPTNGFEISTCHYCDMAYVNIYTVDPTDDGLYFMNTASREELKRKLGTKSDKTIDTIVSKRPYNTIADFEDVGVSLRWKADKFDKTFKPSYKRRSHFDIDHVLDKGSCPVIALSLMNFVPSCQVCNSRLKKTRILGRNGIPEEKFSPTSPVYDFDNGVTICVLPKLGAIKINPTQSRNNYNLKFVFNDKDYEYLVNLFKLEERYSFHKIEALRWLELQQKYDNAHIEMMANVLNNPDFTVDKIREDIFGCDFTKDELRCFGKMKKDILK